DFDCSCFDGKYVTNDIDDAYLNRIEMLRSDDNIHEVSKSSSQLDLMLDPTSEQEEHA
ncbi:MAG: amidophosphoribosyltransferase, partial [Nitrosomonadales bacterium]|nr:amidophosphoribosyltransferase [Nitrosomonadales bacterium]